MGNLGWDTTSDDLNRVFGQYGRLTDAKVVTDRDTGNSRGFGFLTYENAESAEAAISGMDGTDLDGREIREAANEIGRRIQSEDGVGLAVAMLENVLADGPVTTNGNLTAE